MTNLSMQRKLAAKVFGCSYKKVSFDTSKLNEIKDVITTSGMVDLVKNGVVSKKKTNHQSRGRARALQVKKSNNQRRGQGSRKGAKYARLPRKEQWINRVRAQREMLLEFKAAGKLTQANFKMLYNRSKGGFFRSKRHLKLYIDERGLLQ